jgi:hypothetical protein
VSDRDDRLLQDKMEGKEDQSAQQNGDGENSEEEQDETMGNVDVERGPRMSAE